MALLPRAHATSLLRRDDAGRTLFFPAGQRESRYVVPDIETEQRIRRQLQRIRVAQLVAWALLPVVVFAALAVSDAISVSMPEWLFASGFAILLGVTLWVPEWARHRLARGLAAEAGEPSLLGKLPAWAITLLIVVAIGLVLYLRQRWPVNALAWLDDPAHVRPVLKALAIAAAAIAGGAALLWGSLGKLRSWFGSSGAHLDPAATDEKK
jgi:hypothetical protein